MKQLVPPQFLFRFAVACRYRSKMPKNGRHVVDLPREYCVPFFSEMEGQPRFADVRMAWNETGLGLQWEVHVKGEPLYGEPDRPTACDGLSLWLDTRDTRTIHRASRYCQRFVLMAHNGHQPGEPEIKSQAIHRAIDSPPAADLSQVRLVRLGIDEDGDLVGRRKAQGGRGKKIVNYRMEVFLPATVLHGFDPEINRRLGFFYRVRDRELGDQLLSAGPEFPYWEDPSLWCTLELLRD